MPKKDVKRKRKTVICLRESRGGQTSEGCDEVEAEKKLYFWRLAMTFLASVLYTLLPVAGKSFPALTASKLLCFSIKGVLYFVKVFTLW